MIQTCVTFLVVSLALASFAQAQFTRGDVVKATTTVHGDGTRSTLVVDPEKQSAEETFFDAAGKVSRKIVYPLDGQNQPIGAINYDARGNIIAKSSYQRDAAGRISEETITSASGQFLRRRVYSYATQNKVSRIDEYDANGVLIVPPKPASTSRGIPDKKKR